MHLPAFIYTLLLLTGLIVRHACAQGLPVQSSLLPVIEGKINGMDVMARGDSVALFAGQLSQRYGKESCSEDSHCTKHKNHSRVVIIRSEDARLLLGPGHPDQNEDEDGEPASLIFPSLTLNTLEGSATPGFVERFMSTEEIEPTPVLATFNSGAPVMMSGFAWVSLKVMTLSTTVVETANLLSTPASTMDDDYTQVQSSPSKRLIVLTTITGELDTLRERLMSSASLPVPTPVQNNSDDPELEANEACLETQLDILNIRPSPGRLGIKGTSSFSFSVKPVLTADGGCVDGLTSVQGSFTVTGGNSATQQSGASVAPVSLPHNRTGRVWIKY